MGRPFSSLFDPLRAIVARVSLDLISAAWEELPPFGESVFGFNLRENKLPTVGGSESSSSEIVMDKNV